MLRVSERMVQYYNVRREISQIADLATYFLARLTYDVPARQPAAVTELVRRLKGAGLDNVSQGRKDEAFQQWLRGYLVVNETIRGTSFYPLHPALTLAANGEGMRVERFLESVANCFTPDERNQLLKALWSPEHLPAFEGVIYDLINRQLPDSPVAPEAPTERFAGAMSTSQGALTPEGILATTKADLLALPQTTSGVQAYIAHAGRLLAFALSRYLLAYSGVDFTLPIYAAPAADSHEGVKTLAHGIIEYHRSQLRERLRDRFLVDLQMAMAETGCEGDPPDEATAQQLAKRVFDPNSNVVPNNQYATLIEEHGSFGELAYAYYWSHSGAAGRFLRQLHASHLNLAKKAGFANSRSQNSRWHFYWMAPVLVETLLLVSQPRIESKRVLLADLLADWRERYGIAVLIDSSWQEAFRTTFRGLGSPESLNEANTRRFTEILAERGRLHKNSDDFPWVILQD